MKWDTPTPCTYFCARRWCIVIISNTKGKLKMEIYKKRFFNSIFSYTFSYNREKNAQHLIIGISEKGKYGIIDSRNEIFLPFEYDYISRIGLNIFQISNNGKHGIVMIENEQDEVDLYFADEPENGDFYIAKYIPCEFDNILMPIQEEVLALINYCEDKKRIKLFCTQSYKLSNETISNYMIISEPKHLMKLYKETDHGSVSTYLFNYRTGKVVFDEDIMPDWF